VVENRPGAGTLLAAEHVARAAPDGYTLLYASTSTLITPMINRTSNLDPTRDFDAVVMAQSSPLLIVSRPDFPAKTLAELIAMARERPGRITISHPGVGGVNHLSLAVLMKQANVEFTLVPYNGNNPSLTALVRGEIDVASDSLFATRTLLEANTIRAIGITSAQRAPTHPNVPTFGETLPGYEVTFWGGFMAPRGTPAPILDRLNTEIDAVLKLPDVIERVKTFGAEPVGGSRAQYTKVIADDWVRWGAVVRETGVTSG
jgi:tripartite-type tricarboxylate transporter receptor subunit TctC